MKQEPQTGLGPSRESTIESGIQRLEKSIEELGAVVQLLWKRFEKVIDSRSVPTEQVEKTSIEPVSVIGGELTKLRRQLDDQIQLLVNLNESADLQ